MPDNPNLTLINMEPLDNLPKEAYNNYKTLILNDKLKPSEALYFIMKKHNCNSIHATSVVHLIEHTYPDVDFGRQGFRFNIIDSAYPQNLNQFSDADFDQGIQKILSLPPVEW